ncbi:MAG: type I restriction-modification system subunit M [Lactobacillaceae bacterium]|jgi:type I restriction enzyme M protein|nr:type I restriction-modification system subunit M [Lactobacillaceae bacterium]
MPKTNSMVEDLLLDTTQLLRSHVNTKIIIKYLIPMTFYHLLSAHFLEQLGKEAGFEDTNVWNIQRAYQNGEFKHVFVHSNYYLSPSTTSFGANGNYSEDEWLERFSKTLQLVEEDSENMADIFSDLDMNFTEFGVDLKTRSLNFNVLMTEISRLELPDYSFNRIGAVFSELLDRAATMVGKRQAGFYSTAAVSELLSLIALDDQKTSNSLAIYDPTMGVGSLLLHARAKAGYGRDVTLYGTELSTEAYNIARMNLILHGVEFNEETIANENTLLRDWDKQAVKKFDAVLMHPPYSTAWDAESKLNIARFDLVDGIVPPKSKSDYAFILEGLDHLADTGTMVVSMPLGVLFRGGSEGRIREHLLYDGHIEAVIGLPGNIMLDTAIPTVILVLKKQRAERDVLFIDASEQFEKVRRQNIMTEENIYSIYDAYKQREDIQDFAHLASWDEIEANDFNLNIPRYVENFAAEEQLDIVAVAKELAELDDEIVKTESQIMELLRQFTSNDDDSHLGVESLVDSVKNHY